MSLFKRLRNLWKFNRNRIRFWWWRWWIPVVNRQQLTSGCYGGYHAVWGPFHWWNVDTHHGTHEKGWSWR